MFEDHGCVRNSVDVLIFMVQSACHDRAIAQCPKFGIECSKYTRIRAHQMLENY